MNPHALILSSLLLGAFVLLGGGFAVLYCLGALYRINPLVRAAYGCWTVQFAVAIAISVLTPLTAGWKVLIVISSLFYLQIPPITWRHLRRLHDLQPKAAGEAR